MLTVPSFLALLALQLFLLAASAIGSSEHLQVEHTYTRQELQGISSGARWLDLNVNERNRTRAICRNSYDLGSHKAFMRPCVFYPGKYTQSIVSASGNMQADFVLHSVSGHGIVDLGVLFAAAVEQHIFSSIDAVQLTCTHKQSLDAFLMASKTNQEGNDALPVTSQNKHLHVYLPQGTDWDTEKLPSFLLWKPGFVLSVPKFTKQLHECFQLDKDPQHFMIKIKSSSPIFATNGVDLGRTGKLIGWTYEVKEIPSLSVFQNLDLSIKTAEPHTKEKSKSPAEIADLSLPSDSDHSPMHLQGWLGDFVEQVDKQFAELADSVESATTSVYQQLQEGWDDLTDWVNDMASGAYVEKSQTLKKAFNYDLENNHVEESTLYVKKNGFEGEMPCSECFAYTKIQVECELSIKDFLPTYTRVELIGTLEASVGLDIGPDDVILGTFEKTVTTLNIDGPAFFIGAVPFKIDARVPLTVGMEIQGSVTHGRLFVYGAVKMQGNVGMEWSTSNPVQATSNFDVSTSHGLVSLPSGIELSAHPWFEAITLVTVSKIGGPNVGLRAGIEAILAMGTTIQTSECSGTSLSLNIRPDLTIGANLALMGKDDLFEPVVVYAGRKPLKKLCLSDNTDSTDSDGAPQLEIRNGAVVGDIWSGPLESTGSCSNEVVTPGQVLSLNVYAMDDNTGFPSIVIANLPQWENAYVTCMAQLPWELSFSILSSQQRQTLESYGIDSTDYSHQVQFTQFTGLESVNYSPCATPISVSGLWSDSLKQFLVMDKFGNQCYEAELLFKGDADGTAYDPPPPIYSSDDENLATASSVWTLSAIVLSIMLSYFLSHLAQC